MLGDGVGRRCAPPFSRAPSVGGVRESDARELVRQPARRAGRRARGQKPASPATRKADTPWARHPTIATGARENRRTPAAMPRRVRAERLRQRPARTTRASMPAHAGAHLLVDERPDVGNRAETGARGRDGSRSRHCAPSAAMREMRLHGAIHGHQSNPRILVTPFAGLCQLAAFFIATSPNTPSVGLDTNTRRRHNSAP